MFGGKKDKALEEALQKATQQLEQKTKIIGQVEKQKDTVEEQFARMTASRAQMDTDLSQVVSHVKYVKETSESNQKDIEGLQDNFKEALTILEEANKGREQFIEKMSAQRDQIQDVVESNKHFTTPAKYLTEYVIGNRNNQDAIKQSTSNITEYAKNMSVISLNAAIEAGRMGDSGRKFVEATEEIRSFSSLYEKEAVAIAKQLEEAEKRTTELEEQIKHLNTLLRDNNVIMSHLMKDSMVSVDEYKKDGKHLKAAYLQDALDQTTDWMEREKEIANRQERILLQMEDIGDEFMEQKECSDELEKICKEVMNSVTMENVGNDN